MVPRDAPAVVAAPLNSERGAAAPEAGGGGCMGCARALAACVRAARARQAGRGESLFAYAWQGTQDQRRGDGWECASQAGRREGERGGAAAPGPLTEPPAWERYALGVVPWKKKEPAPAPSLPSPWSPGPSSASLSMSV